MQIFFIEAYQKGRRMDGTIRVSSRMHPLYRCLIVILSTFFLVACQSNWAPVSDINRSETKLSGVHIVQSGETLYAIGWRYNRDFKELAAANGIPPPYRIHTGQEISLEPVKSNSNVVIGAVEPKPHIVAVTPSAENTVMPPASKAVEQTPAQVMQTQAPHVMPATISIWQWPVKGEILARFAQSKGVDIAGVEGALVHAAADGRIVYSGNGLRGYGQLLIIKHNEQYLSAYAHNSQLTVKEGDWVKQGQPIAQMGSTDTNRVKLHFEIRKDGKPVDPLKYLPK